VSDPGAPRPDHDHPGPDHGPDPGPDHDRPDPDHGHHDRGGYNGRRGDHGPHRPRPASAAELRARALEALLVTKGVVTTDAVDAVISYYEHDVGPQNGAKVVARAWVDPAYRERLLADGTSAIAELGYGGAEGDNMVVVANTPSVHNAVVCTLCSCYPWPVLGLPPAWYKSLPYRARMVAEPRAVLREFGLDLPEEVQIRVWDSSAEVRYLVLPMRPAGTDGWSQERLAGIVTRDSMIGTAAPTVDAGP
jgi:nitrile hydratase